MICCFSFSEAREEAHMDLVQLDENNEVTILASVYERIGAKIGDLFTIHVDAGKIVMQPLRSASDQFSADSFVERDSWA
jgi:hypothetical protein